MEMYNNDYENNQGTKGSIARGLLGALIGAILGAVVWGVVGILTQRVFALIGLLLGFLTAKGYELMKGREGAAKIAIVIVCVILSVVLGEAIYNVGMIHQTFIETRDMAIAELESLGFDIRAILEENPEEAYREYLFTEREIAEMIIADPQWRTDMLKNLGQALLFTALGAAAVVTNLGRKKTAQNNAPADVEATQPQEAPASEEDSSYSA